MKLTPEEQAAQEAYRDARFNKKYDGIWQNVGKCVFCDMRDKYIFFEENGIVMTIALYAYVDGHFFIIPRRHIRSVKEMTPLEWETVRKCMYLAKKIIRKVHGISGVQFIQKEGVNAQSTVEHIHFHCIPFDTPDLSTRNYRKLKNTPLENAELYKNANHKLESYVKNYDEKYKDGTA